MSLMLDGFLWREVMVCMDRSLLSKGRGLNRLTRVSKASYDLTCTPPGPGDVQVLERW